MYQARIHPEQKANALGAEQAAALHAQLQGVLQVPPRGGPSPGRPAGRRAGGRNPGGSAAGALARMSWPGATVCTFAVCLILLLDSRVRQGRAHASTGLGLG